MQTKAYSSTKGHSPVVVETKKISDSCCTSDFWSNCSCSKISHIVMMILLLVNTVFLVMSFSMIRNSESIKVGWWENYKLAKSIYKTEWFKAYQKQQIQQALQMFKWWTSTTQSATNSQQNMDIPSSLWVQGSEKAKVELPKK